jgi:hypothetical protein
MVHRLQRELHSGTNQGGSGGPDGSWGTTGVWRRSCRTGLPVRLGELIALNDHSDGGAFRILAERRVHTLRRTGGIRTSARTEGTPRSHRLEEAPARLSLPPPRSGRSLDSPPIRPVPLAVLASSRCLLVPFPFLVIWLLPAVRPRQHFRLKHHRSIRTEDTIRSSRSHLAQSTDVPRISDRAASADFRSQDSHVQTA